MYFNENSDFHFFVEVDAIEKASKEKGGKKMKIRGIASTNHLDRQNEILEPEGFDFKPFLDYGFFNWHHQSNGSPEAAAIGEPTSASINEKGEFVVEGFLYEDNRLAKEVFSLIKTLKKNSSKRRIGFSVEGKALERDPLNTNRVLRSRIYHCALTHDPINRNSFAEVVKGGNYNTEPPKYFPDKIISNPNGGKILILDRENFSLEIGEDFEVTITEKALTTSNASAIIPESLEKKKEEKDGKKEENEGITSEGLKQLIKAQFNDSGLNPELIDEKLKRFLKFKKITEMENNFSSERVEEALNFLKGALSGENDLIKGAKKDNDKKDGEPFYEKGDGDFYRKCMMKGGKKVFVDENKYEKKGDSYSVMKANDTDEEEEENEMKGMKKGDKMKKGETIEVTADGINYDDLVKGMADIFSNQRSTNDALGTAISGLLARLETIEQNQKALAQALSTPTVPKAIQKGNDARAILDRHFNNLQPATEIQKASNGSQPTGTNVISLSNFQQRKRLIDICDMKTFNGAEMDETFSKATLSLESGAKELPQEVIARLKSENGITVVA